MKNFLLAGLAGGAAMALLTNLPVLALGNCLLCLWVWGGGMFSAWLYKRLQGSVSLNQAGWLGAMAGLLGGAASGLITFYRGTGTGLLPGQIASQLPLEYAEQLQSMGMLPEMVATFALLEVFAFVFLGALGGLIGGLLWRDKPDSLSDPVSAQDSPMSLVMSPISKPPAEAATAGYSLPVDTSPPLNDPSVSNLPLRTFTPPPQPRPLEGRGDLPPEEYPPLDDAP
jgi:hypothetical protein